MYIRAKLNARASNRVTFFQTDFIRIVIQELYLCGLVQSTYLNRNHEFPLQHQFQNTHQWPTNWIVHIQVETTTLLEATQQSPPNPVL